MSKPGLDGGRGATFRRQFAPNLLGGGGDQFFEAIDGFLTATKSCSGSEFW